VNCVVSINVHSAVPSVSCNNNNNNISNNNNTDRILHVCVFLCVGHTDVICKTAEPIEMPFGGLFTWVQGTMLDGIWNGRIHLQPRGVTSR